MRQKQEYVFYNICTKNAKISTIKVNYTIKPFWNRFFGIFLLHGGTAGERDGGGGGE